MNELLALLPEMVLAVTILLVFTALLGADGRARHARDAARLGGVLLVTSCLASFGHPAEFLHASYRVDGFSQLVKLGVAVGFLLSVFIARDGVGQRDDARGELFFFLLTSACGLTVMASAVEALSLYLALEIASFSLFVLVPLREGFPAGKESGLKFLVVGLSASALGHDLRPPRRPRAPGPRPRASA